MGPPTDSDEEEMAADDADAKIVQGRVAAISPVGIPVVASIACGVNR